MSEGKSLEERRQAVLDQFPDIAEFIRLARKHFGESCKIEVSLEKAKKEGAN